MLYISTTILGLVKVVEDVSGVEDVSRGSAGLMRVRTHIADKRRGFHRESGGGCGSRGKGGWPNRCGEPVFQMSGDAQAGFRKSGAW